MALIDNAPRSATAIAATDAKLVPVGDARHGAAIARDEYGALINC